jgi:hypothetical protein
MKKALVLGLLVLAFGAAASAQEFTGSWDVDAYISLQTDSECATVLGCVSLDSVLSLDYTIGCVTMGMDTWVDQTELIGLGFSAYGTLGAFSFWSGLFFDPVAPAFADWENVVSVSIAGVELIGVFAIQDLHYQLDDAIAVGTTGVGWALLGHAVCGDVEVWGEVAFNLGSMLSTWYTYGFDYLLAWDMGYSSTCSGAFAWGNWTVQTESCCACLNAVNIWAEWPLGCLDVLAKLSFTCDGFSSFCINLNDVDLGAGWFQLDDLDICFTTTSKTVWTDFTLLFGSALCVTPYFDLIQDSQYSFTGIRLEALLFKYAFDGVTIKAGELFGTEYYKGFTSSGALTTYAACAVTGANEFFGIWYDGDACCGGLIGASFIVFFDGINLNAGVGVDTSTSTGIFDFVYSVASIEIGIGSNFSFRTSMYVSDEGLETIGLGFSFNW